MRSWFRYWRTLLFLVVGYGWSIGMVLVYQWSRTASLVMVSLVVILFGCVYVKAIRRDRAEGRATTDDEGSE